MRKSSRRPVHGILLLDKPLGISSNAALQKAKWLFNARKAGHTGSLDPLASGLLPLCFGEATKISQHLIDCDKRYRAVMQLGVVTTTGDAEGEVVAERPVGEIARATIEQLMAGFCGEIEQIPPMFSALKHQGKPLYKLAVKGIEVDRQPRTVRIFALQLLEYKGTTIEFDVHCSKGTYIRTLAEDLGQKLGCGAHLVALRRYAVGQYTEAGSVSLQELESLHENGGCESLDGRLLPLDSGLWRLPRLDLDDIVAKRLCNGQRIALDKEMQEGLIRLYSPRSGFFGLGERRANGQLAPRRIFHFSV